MRKNRDPDFDLFAWADSRPSAIIIDARRIFQKRALAFVRLICVDGFVPKVTNGEVIDIRSRPGIEQRQRGKRRRSKNAA
jgi:hypothetical protein